MSNGIVGRGRYKITGDIELEPAETQAEGPATLLLVLREDRPNFATWQASDIVGVYPVDLPLADAGQVPGQGGTDPRVPEQDIYAWQIVSNKLPTDAATAENLPELSAMTDLDEVWRYNITYEPIQDSPQTRTRYTTDNVSQTGRYGFTDEFLASACLAFEENFVTGPNLGEHYTCTKSNEAATSIIFRFKDENGNAIPNDRLLETREWMLQYMSSPTLESRRYDFTDFQMSALQVAEPDPYVIIDTWENVSAQIEDGYGK